LKQSGDLEDSKWLQETVREWKTLPLNLRPAFYIAIKVDDSNVGQFPEAAKKLHQKYLIPEMQILPVFIEQNFINPDQDKLFRSRQSIIKLVSHILETNRLIANRPSVGPAPRLWMDEHLTLLADVKADHLRETLRRYVSFWTGGFFNHYWSTGVCSHAQLSWQYAKLILSFLIGGIAGYVVFGGDGPMRNLTYLWANKKTVALRLLKGLAIALSLLWIIATLLFYFGGDFILGFLAVRVFGC